METKVTAENRDDLAKKEYMTDAFLLVKNDW